MADLKITQLPNASTPLTGAEIVPVVQGGVTKEVSVTNLTAGRVVSASKVGAGVASPTLNFEVLGEYVYPTLGTASGGFKIASSNGLYGLFGGVSGATGFSWLQAMRTDSATSYDIVLNPAGGNVQLGAGNLVQGTAAKGINFTANTPAAGMTSRLLNWYEEGTFTPTISFAVNTGVSIYAPQTGARYTRIGRQVHVQGRVTMQSIGTASGTCYLGTFPFTAGSGYEAVSAAVISVDDGVFRGTLAQGTDYCDLSATVANFTNTSIVRFSLTYSI